MVNREGKKFNRASHMSKPPEKKPAETCGKRITFQLFEEALASVARLVLLGVVVVELALQQTALLRRVLCFLRLQKEVLEIRHGLNWMLIFWECSYY
jgi:hypothetical protein